MRRFSALTLLLALPMAALWDPFVHAHFDSTHTTTHHDGRVIHSHAETHRPHRAHTVSAGPSVSVSFAADENEDAGYLTTFVATECCAPPSTDVVVAAETLVRPPRRVCHFDSMGTRNHDPPDSGSDAPRAPPSFLS